MKLKLSPPPKHTKVNVLLTIENGQVVDTRSVRDDEFVGSLNTFVWMLRKAGYVVCEPHPAMNAE